MLQPKILKNYLYGQEEHHSMDDPDDFTWFLSASLKRYRGKHIAILNRRIIASGTNAKEVWERAHKKNPENDFLMTKVPEDDILIL